MPIYEYECQKCKAHTEILQKIMDKPLVKCRKCGGRLEKQWSQSGFQFKGSGWYVTDYASKKSGGTDEKKNSTNDESKTADKNASVDKSTTVDKAVKPEAASKVTEKKSASSNTARDDK